MLCDCILTLIDTHRNIYGPSSSLSLTSSTCPTSSHDDGLSPKIPPRDAGQMNYPSRSPSTIFPLAAQIDFYALHPLRDQEKITTNAMPPNSRDQCQWGLVAVSKLRDRSMPYKKENRPISSLASNAEYSP